MRADELAQCVRNSLCGSVESRCACSSRDDDRLSEINLVATVPLARGEDRNDRRARQLRETKRPLGNDAGVSEESDGAPAHPRRYAIDLQRDDTAVAQVSHQRKGCQWIVVDVQDLHAYLRLPYRVLKLLRALVALAPHDDHHSLAMLAGQERAQALPARRMRRGENNAASRRKKLFDGRASVDPRIRYDPVFRATREHLGNARREIRERTADVEGISPPTGRSAGTRELDGDRPSRPRHRKRDYGPDEGR